MVDTEMSKRLSRSSGASQTPGEDKMSIPRRKLRVNLWKLLPSCMDYKCWAGFKL